MELAISSKFVTNLFAVMVEKAADCGGSVAAEVLHTVAVGVSDVGRFARNAVADGIVGSAAVEVTGDTAKRRKTGGRGPEPMLRLVTRALEQKTSASLHKYAIRILRSPALGLRRLLQPADTAHWGLRLLSALADRGSDILHGGDESVANGVFAALRDVIPLVALEDGGLAGVDRLCADLAGVFEPRLADGTVYAFCSAKRHRCYQWAVFWRLSTWAARGSPGSDMGWTHISHAVGADAEPSIWLLLIAEPLWHVAGEYPAADMRALAGLSSECQQRAFVAVAQVIGRIADALPASSDALWVLLPGVVGACGRLLRLVGPAAASLGDCASDGEKHHAKTIAGVFSGLSSLARAIAEQAPAPAALALAFRTALRWITVYASCARDGGAASDWARLQSVTTADAECRAGVVQSLRMLVGLSLWSLLDAADAESELRRLSRDWGTREPVGLCQALQRLEEFQSLSLCALQGVASVLGVRTRGAAPRPCGRGPRSAARSATRSATRSAEALMHLAVQSGLARVLAEPPVVVRFVRRVGDGSMLRDSAALRGLQMWAEMVGVVARHTLFRSYLGPGFSAWWALALAASTRCLADAVEEGKSAEMVRLACVLPAHLLSWQAHLPASDIPPATQRDSQRTESTRQLHAWLSSFPQPPSGPSIVSPVYFLACKLWLDKSLFGHPQVMGTIARDVHGIATNALRFLKRLVVLPMLRHVFCCLGLVDDFASRVLVHALSAQGLPAFVSQCLGHRARPPGPGSETPPQTSDLITIPLIEFTNDKNEVEYRSEYEESPGSAGDLVDRLLDDFSHSRSPHSRPQPMPDRCSEEEVLGQLWHEYIDGLLGLPESLVFPRTKDHADSALVFALCEPLLSVRESLAQPNALWRALSLTPPNVMRMGVRAAAFLLPDLNTTLHCDVDEITVVVRELVVGTDRKPSTVALHFMAWRQYHCISRQVSKCATQLKNNLPAVDTTSRKLSDLVRLRGYNPRGTDDLPVSGMLLSMHSPVFSAMLTGFFAEARGGVVSLDCDHDALSGMVDIFRRYVHACSHTIDMERLCADLVCDYDYDELAVILDLAVFYALRPVVALLAWRFASGFNEHGQLADETVDRLALLYVGGLGGYQGSLMPIRRTLAAVLWLRLDQIDLGDVVGDTPDEFVESLLFLLGLEQ
ncbi:hypothetical protein GGI20_001065 [Coemansia sp. BCRC 34301]|nr:hypothetical protein GGI20_001065 [Coemansia sp. BCRC 34301]